MKIGCHVLQWGMAINETTRYTWDGKVHDVSLPMALDDVAALRFEGFDCSDSDLIPYFPDPRRFVKIREDRGLEFGSAWVTLLPKKLAKGERGTVNPKLPMSDPSQFLPLAIPRITEKDLEKDFPEKLRFARKMSEFGSKVITFGGPFMARQDIRDEYYRMVGEFLNSLAEEMKEFGIRPALHHHLSTLVQDEGDIDKLYDYADKNLVGLCMDTAHLTAAGFDPVRFVDKYSSRIFHVHLKDLFRGRFVELGTGKIDLRAAVDALREHGYDGWVVAELDIPRKTAYESAQINRRYMASVLGH
jgi:sugar phosphate isomerase/epimerase